LGSSEFYNFVDETLRDNRLIFFGILAANESKFRRQRASLEKWEDILKGDHDYECRKKSATSLACLRSYMGDLSWVMVTEICQDETRFHIAMGEECVFGENFESNWRELSGGWRMKRPIEHEGMCRLFTSMVMRQGLTFSTCFDGRIANCTAEDFQWWTPRL